MKPDQNADWDLYLDDDEWTDEETDAMMEIGLPLRSDKSHALFAIF